MGEICANKKQPLTMTLQIAENTTCPERNYFRGKQNRSTCTAIYPCWPRNIPQGGKKAQRAPISLEIDLFVLLERYPGVGGGDADSRRWAAGAGRMTDYDQKLPRNRTGIYTKANEADA